MRHDGTPNLVRFDLMDKLMHKEISSRGGKNCLIKKRERRTMRQWAEELGDGEITLPDGTLVERMQMVLMQQFKNALNGDVRSARFIADLLGETTQAQMLKQGPTETNITLKID